VKGPTPYERWLKAVGLASHFPRLDRVEFTAEDALGRPDDDRFYFGQPHEELIEAAIQSLAQNAIANLIPDGHGISTLARYVYHRSSREAALRSLIPVWISLEDLLIEGLQKAEAKDGAPLRINYRDLLNRAPGVTTNPEAAEEQAEVAFAVVTIDHVEDTIQEAVQSAIITSLVSEPWERIIGRATYAELVGAESTSADELEKHRRHLASLLQTGGNALEVLSGTELSVPWTELMLDLSAQANVRLSLQFDLSPSPIGRYYMDGDQSRDAPLSDDGDPNGDGDQNGDVPPAERLTSGYLTGLENVAAAVKNVLQSAPGGASFINRAFFLSPQAWSTFESQVTKGAETAKFPPYSALDVFTILAVHYRRGTGGKKDRKDELAAVLDSELIRYREEMALSTMVEDLSSRLHRMRPTDMRFQLSGSFQGMWALPRTEVKLRTWQRGIEEKVEQLSTDVETIKTLVDRMRRDGS
jgi:hypothetical protein